MHGGQPVIGAANPSFTTGRHSRYLPAQLDRLYQEALSNPDLLEMADHMALLESRINEILATVGEGEPVPKWSEVREAFDSFATGVLGDGDQDAVVAALESINRLLDNGVKWDRAWVEIMSTMEQLRKLADTEIKRKKELHQMVPVERVVVLMAAVGMAVKRNVSDPAEVAAVYQELAMLQGSDVTLEGERPRMAPDVVVPSGGSNRRKLGAGREQGTVAAPEAD